MHSHLQLLVDVLASVFCNPRNFYMIAPPLVGREGGWMGGWVGVGGEQIHFCSI